MTKLSVTMVAAAGLALSGGAFLGCASNRPPERGHHERPGEYLDDSVITMRVKAALIDEPSLKSFQIHVKTYEDVVQLTGFVDSSHSARRAGEVAARVRGVSSVRNDLIVKR